MKTKRILSTMVVVILLLTQTVMAKDYSDYPQRFWDVSKDHWAYSYISELTDKNVISGYEDGSFRPEETVSRAEWSKMLVVASGKQPISLEDNKSYAIDYNSKEWYYGYINSVVDYMNFYNDGGNYYFKPNQSASREDVTVSLVKLKGYNVDNVDYSYISKFKDSNSISNDLKKYVSVAIEKELISGYEDNTFRGQDTLTRAEAATLLCRAFQLGNDNKTTNSNSVYLDPSEVNSNVNNETNKEESKNDSESDLSDSENSSGNTIINNNTTINNNGSINVNNGVINNNYSSENESEKEDEENNSVVEEENENEDTPYHEYEIDTLVEANTKYRLYTSHEDNLYYIEGDTIYKVNMITRDKETVIDFEDIVVNYEGKNYTASSIRSLFYDNKRDTLAVYGDFENKTVFGDSSGIYARAVSVPDCEYLEINKSMSDYPHILGVTKNGYVPEQYGIGFYSGPEFKRIVEFKGGIDFYEKDNSIHFISNGRYAIYDYNELKEVVNYKNVTSAGINKNDVVFIGNNQFMFVNDESNVFSTEDIYVKDYGSLNTNNFEKLCFINSNNDVVVYDKINKCFRIIYKNK